MFMHSNRSIKRKRGTRHLRLRLDVLEARLTPSTFHVNTTLDTVAVNLKTGKDASGHISLRSAIMAADANPNLSDTIVLPAGTFNLTIAPSGNDGPSSGDLDILVDKKITIKGSTHGGQTIINGTNQDRVFVTASGNVAISNVVIEHGQAVGQGGGLLNDGANDKLTSVQFLDNVVVGQDGAIGAPGAAGLAGGPGGAGTNGEGGAICNLAGSLTLTNCVLDANEAFGGSGAIGGSGGAGGSAGDRLHDGSGVAGNGGDGGAGGAGGAGEGGGVWSGPGATLTLSGDTFLKNEAIGGSGGNGGNGGVARGGDGASDTGAGAGIGGSAAGGAGGAAGTGGLGAGGGLYVSGGQVTLAGSSTTFNSNEAGGEFGGNGGSGGKGVGGSGGNGINPGAGEGGGTGDAGAGGGAGGTGGTGGAGEGGAIFNGPGGSISSTAAVVLQSNSAIGFTGGAGGNGGDAVGGRGGNGGANTGGGPGGAGGAGSDAFGGNAGVGGDGGVGEGGGIFDAALATVSFTAGKNTKAPPPSSFTANKAVGGNPGRGGNGGSATGGNGGNAGTGADPSAGGNAGSATSGFGNNGGAGGDGSGGGLFDDGTASLTGVTVNFTSNQAAAGSGGSGGDGGADAFGGYGGAGAGGVGGAGGNATAGNGGNADFTGVADGGGIFVGQSGTLVLKPRLGAKKGSRESKATDVITLNAAVHGALGTPGTAGGSVAAGIGGNLHGTNGTDNLGHPGGVVPLVPSAGGGIANFGTATVDNTSITGNSADVFPNIDGTLSS